MTHGSDGMIPLIEIPPLRAAQRGKYRLNRERLPHTVSGYFIGQRHLSKNERRNWVLSEYTRTGKRRIWMSVTPMERESQSHHALAAKGRVLIGGLGLGALLWAVLNKPEVTHVTVVERDHDVLNIMQEVWSQDDRWKKFIFSPRFNIVMKDIFDVTPADVGYHDMDYTLIDIWPVLGDMNLRADMQRINRSLHCGRMAAWGMELDFISWCSQSGIEQEDLKVHHWNEYSESIGVPLIGHEWKWMTGMALNATRVTCAEWLRRPFEKEWR